MPDKEEVLEKISKFTKIPEMVISFLMLGTGVFSPDECQRNQHPTDG